MDSGLNSVVLANNDEMILLPINEPTYGTKRKSQIQTYLEQNNVRTRVVCHVLSVVRRVLWGKRYDCLVSLTALRFRVTDFV